MLEVESQWAGYQLQLAAEQEEQAAQQAAVAYQIGTRQEAAARAAFWRLWKTPYERVKRVRPANQRDDVQWCNQVRVRVIWHVPLGLTVVRGGGGWGTAAMHTCTDYCLRKKECRFGFGEENKLIPFVAIARPGTRIVEEKEAELKINPWDTYLAAMQKKIPDRHGQMQYVSADTLCFDVHAAREDKVCPVWTFWKTRAVWPLDSTEGESYCEDLSLIHI